MSSDDTSAISSYSYYNAWNQDFEVIWDRTCGDRLGLEVGKWPPQRMPTLLRVLEVRDGVVSEWNSSGKGRRVRAGDTIVEVNGVSEDAEKLIMELQKKEILACRIRPGDSLQPFSFRDVLEEQARVDDGRPELFTAAAIRARKYEGLEGFAQFGGDVPDERLDEEELISAFASSASRNSLRLPAHQQQQQQQHQPRTSLQQQSPPKQPQPSHETPSESENGSTATSSMPISWVASAQRAFFLCGSAPTCCPDGPVGKVVEIEVPLRKSVLESYETS